MCLHWWFSGRILACHAGGPGSIPGPCRVQSLLVFTPTLPLDSLRCTPHLLHIHRHTPLGHWATAHTLWPVSLASPHSDNYLEPPSNHLTHSAYPLTSTNKKLHTQPTHSPPPPSYAFPSPSSSPRSYIFVFWRYTLPLFRYTRRHHIHQIHQIPLNVVGSHHVLAGN